MKHPKRLWLIVFGALAVVVLVLGLILGKKQTSLPQVSPVPTFTPHVINQYETVLYEEKKRFAISFLPQENRYIITIYGSPFVELRQEAETRLLAVLRLNKTQACVLNVSIETLPIINPEEANKTHRLSFCDSPATQPQLPLDPRLEPLQVISIHPKPGEAEIGNTRVSVFVTFSKPVNLNTVGITIFPELPFVTRLHPEQKSQLLIVPESDWQSNTSYSLTVKSGLVSEDNQSQLKEDVLLKYEVKEIKFPSLPPEGI